MGNYMTEYALDTDNGKKDSNGNGCDWYDANYRNESYFTERYQWDNCNAFNTPEFNAKEMCAICNGGFKFMMDCRSD